MSTLLAFSPVRILLDYRPALKERSGVGEYIHELGRALARQLQGDDRLVLFTSSWADRLPDGVVRGWPRTDVVDRRLPVRALTFGWNRLTWPPVESLAGRVDIVHSASPLLIPARRARQVLTVHDLDFLAHPERTSAEMRRDYGPLVLDHAGRAKLIVVNSEHTSQAVIEQLRVPADRVVVCQPGVPPWIPGGEIPVAPGSAERYVLFVGTLEPRKNLGVLLDAWERLLADGADLPRLRVAGGLRPGGEGWAERIRRPPLSSHVDYVGYVDASARQALYQGAQLLVLPSFHEGFGLPVVEAMAFGVPVITSDRGALPEVAGDAGIVVPADDPTALARAILRVLTDRSTAEAMARRGLARAATFTWDAAAERLYAAYRRLLERA